MVISIAIFISLILVLCYHLNNTLFKFWSKRGFKQLEPRFFFGDAKSLLLRHLNIGEYYQMIYSKYKEHKVLGLYISYNPVLLINDPKIIQDILIKDFNLFHDRPAVYDEEYDPLSAHLFNIEGQKWRDLRVKLTPAFSSGKLKLMLPIISDCGKVLVDYLASNIKNGIEVFEFHDLMARFTTNVISSVAFGIDNDCINEPGHIFRRMGSKFFEPNFSNGVRGLIAFAVPKIFYKLRLKKVTDEVEDFMISMVKQSVDYREQQNFWRNDFLQMLIRLKNEGFVSVDKIEETKSSGDSNRLSFNQLAANVFVFFIAGD